jgi:hypothetical protein
MTVHENPRTIAFNGSSTVMALLKAEQNGNKQTAEKVP